MFAGASPYNSEAAGAATALAGVRVRGGFRIACRYQDGATRVSDLDESGGWRIRFPELHHTRHIEAVSINTGGGIIGGDHIACQIAADSGHLVVASQAAERIYRSLGPPARITSTFTLGGGANLDWLPQETILFSGARLHRSYDVTMADTARLLMVESIILGRTASGEAVRDGGLNDQWRIRRGGRLVYAEALRVEGDMHTHLLRAATGGEARALATLLFVAPDAADRLALVRATTENCELDCGVSAWNGMLVARFVARDAARLRQCLVKAVQAVSDRALPRVWSL